jgi:hypothetical protein
MEKHTKDGSLLTAEEFIKEAQSNPSKGWTARKLMIEFTKMHVEAALKAAINNVEVTTGGDGSPLFSITSIINSYPLENIK